jgi:ElaB/YqjD/DUF883 family membrane-anchored ribosome-binding protein
MADSTDSSSNMMGESRAAGRVYSTAPTGGERAGSVVVEFLDAARSAAESLLEEQKRQVAERVSGVAEALRNAIGPLDRSQNAIIARVVEQAADHVESLTRAVRSRRWNELVADTEDFARRQPTLFVLGAVAAGFTIGRLLWTAPGQEHKGDAIPGSNARRAVTASVSSGSGTPDVDLTHNAPLPSDGIEVP